MTFCHRRFFAQARFSKVSEWKQFISELDEETHGWLEWQAYAFAGLILVPALPLKQRLQQAYRLAARKRLSPAQAGDVARLYIVSWLAKQFEVSSQVIERRLDKDRLWAVPS
jgi:Zn-dependent peptidase ImmA (M78 family)